MIGLRARPANHRVQIGARRHHRVHRVFLLDLEIDDHRLAILARRLDRRNDVRALRHRRRRQAERLGQLLEIRVHQRRRRIPPLVEELLPLAHHPEVPVVDDRHVDVDLLLHDRRKLAHRHLEAAVADDHPHFLVRARELGADRRRQREAHRAEAARRDERARLVVVVVLRFPHLVLADVGHDDGVAVGRAPQIVDDVRGVQMPAVGQVLDVANRRVSLELLDVREPLAAIAGLHARHQHFERFLQSRRRCPRRRARSC